MISRFKNAEVRNFGYVNTAAERLSGLRREEMLGRVYWEMFPEVVGTDFERACGRAMDEGVTVQFEQYYAPSERWFEQTVYPLAEGIILHSRDVTGRKRTEESLTFHAHLLENVHDAIVATDERLVVTAWNRAAEGCTDGSRMRSLAATSGSSCVLKWRRDLSVQMM